MSINCPRNIKWKCPNEINFIRNTSIGLGIIFYTISNGNVYLLLPKKRNEEYTSYVYYGKNRVGNFLYNFLNRETYGLLHFDMKNITHTFIIGNEYPTMAYLFVYLNNIDRSIPIKFSNLRNKNDPNTKLVWSKLSAFPIIRKSYILYLFSEKYKLENSTFIKSVTNNKKSQLFNKYECSRDARMYHLVCDRVWNVDCKNMTKKQLENSIKDIELCKYLRKRHSDICFEGKIDPGHLGAMKKMDNFKRKCSLILKKSKNENDLVPVIKNKVDKLMKYLRENDGIIELHNVDDILEMILYLPKTKEITVTGKTFNKVLIDMYKKVFK